MKQYIQVYRHLLRLNFAALTAYRINFINSFISSLSWGIFSVGQILLLTAKTSSVYGWTRTELLLLTASYSVAIGIFHLFFSANFNRMSTIIHRGELDSYLLKPLDEQFLLSFWLTNFTNFFRIIFGIGLIIYLFSFFSLPINPISIFTFLFLLFAGILLLYSIWFGVTTLLIWFTHLENLMELMYNVTGIAKYPQELFGGVRSYIIGFLLPITIIVSTPARSLFQSIAFSEATQLVVLSAAMLYISRKFWKFALRYYTSASS